MSENIERGSNLLCARKCRAVDRTGKRYGRLLALFPLEERKNGAIVWHCVCDCGREVDVRGTLLSNGLVQSCGCLKRERLTNRSTDHTGKRYGKLVAIEPAAGERSNGGVVWRCRCDCGNEVLVRGNYLSNGEKTCCGKCSPKERARVLRYIRELQRTGVVAERVLSALRSIEEEK